MTLHELIASLGLRLYNEADPSPGEVELMAFDGSPFIHAWHSQAAMPPELLPYYHPTLLSETIDKQRAESLKQHAQDAQPA